MKDLVAKKKKDLVKGLVQVLCEDSVSFFTKDRFQIHFHRKTIFSYFKSNSK